MNHYINNLYVLIILLACATSQATAEDLLDIYQSALENDPIIRGAEARYLAILESKPQARSAMFPFISFSAGETSSYSKDPNQPTNYATGQPDPFIGSTQFDRDSSLWNIQLEQTLFDWGRFLRLRQADKRVAQAEINYQIARQNLLVRVATTYFLVLAAEDTLTSQISAREAIGRQLEQAQRRFEVGLIAITDVQEAQAGYDQTIAAEILAKRNLATTQEYLREIVGQSVVDLDGPVDELPLLQPDPPNPEQWVQTALDRNLTLLSSRISSDIALDEISVQRSFRLPTLSFSAALSRSSSDTMRTNNLLRSENGSFACTSFCPPEQAFSGTDADNYFLSFNFNIPLFTGGYNSSKIKQSVYERRAALEDLEAVSRATERETRDAYLSVISEISRVRALSQAVTSSETALRATEAGFEVGTRTTVEVLMAQNNLSTAETAYARSRYDYILNILRLRFAAGSLTLRDFEEVNDWLTGS
jgi:outer membrane protein